MTPQTLLIIETIAIRIGGAVVETISALMFFGAVGFFWIITP